MNIIERRDLVSEVVKRGYKLVRSKGSHDIYSNGKNNIVIPIRLNPCIAIRLAKEVGAKHLIK